MTAITGSLLGFAPVGAAPVGVTPVGVASQGFASVRDSLEGVLSQAPVCRSVGPEYYAFDLVSTARVPGTRRAGGIVQMEFAASPFGISLGEAGSYVHRLELQMERLKKPRSGTYVVWITTREVDEIVLAGELTDFGEFHTEVAWNKFLVVVTHEVEFDPDAERWSGPVAFRGMPRSGRMHTMAGHGPFEEEKCATYGYN